MNWKIGDIAIIDCPKETVEWDWHGREVEIISPCISDPTGPSYRTSPMPTTVGSIYSEYLRPLPPHTDPGSWEEMKDIFNPFVVTVDA